MKLGIMQPYFFPYIGYWQRIAAVDKHVIYDDVNFIKGGWINRNRILLNNEIHYFNLPMKNASPNKLINEVGVDNSVIKQKKMIMTLEQAYKKAPNYCNVMPLLADVISSSEINLAKYLIYQIQSVCDYLDIGTELIISSDLVKDNFLRAQDKVLEICRILEADEYLNARSGEHLYSKEAFAQNGIKLSFIEANDIQYRQFSDRFEPSLSIIDVMMFNSKDINNEMLKEYSIT